jgi:hypothetical protein
VTFDKTMAIDQAGRWLTRKAEDKSVRRGSVLRYSANRSTLLTVVCRIRTETRLIPASS